MMAHRREALQLYRKILRLSKTWRASSGVLEDTKSESRYIRDEARTLFRQNKNITDESDIQQHLAEANARMEIAVHYQNPYPRPMNYPQTVLPPSGKLRKTTEKTMSRAKPVYIKSYDVD